jgi:ribosomal protein L40E
MDELTKYIVTCYPNLMTFKEKAANKAFLAEEKAENLEPGNMQRMLRKSWGSSDPDVLSLMANGREEFLRAVRDRIMDEHSDEVFLNYCPKCGALAKTPRAKQCPKCFFSWHDSI